MNTIKNLNAWPSALLLTGCLHWPDAPEDPQVQGQPKGIEEIQLPADGPLRAKASAAFSQLTAWPSAEQDQLNKAIESIFVNRYKPAFTEMLRQAAAAENEASSDPTKLGASFYDWTIQDSYESAYLSR